MLERINKSQLPNDNSSNNSNKQLPIGLVDELANELVTEYSNPVYRQWYCGVIYQFGTAKVEEWRGRAKEGREPAKLFSKYVTDARRTRFRRPEAINE